MRPIAGGPTRGGTAQSLGERPSVPVLTEAIRADASPGISKKTLQERVNRRLQQLADVLEKDQLFEEKVRDAKFKDIAIAEAILIDKWLLLNDQPTQIIGYEERKKLDELLPALTAELQRRGFSATLEAKAASMTVNVPATVPALALENPPN